MSEDNLQSYIEQKQVLGEKICMALQAEISKLGFADKGFDNLSFDQLSFNLSHDSFAKHDSLEASWLGKRNNRLGSIVFHGDGSFFAEYDVVQPHPSDKRWFIEAIEVWGNESTIKTELKLLSVPE